ncbi:DUF4390 domain-containing protein [Crenobacter sp. HX-7-9]|uniref:DUF4390 domain-containing protein n=1 Tax=Crenobacter caeni TaxID=2705474 RepID=A0A6B2KNS6_9NEIS|nr:DUF4390 domain-containing protein [Crenobacter caeni]
MTAFITRCLKSLSLLLLVAGMGLARADGVEVRRAELELAEHKLQLSTRFHTTLPPVLQDALQQGVPLTFELQFELTRPRGYAYYYDLTSWFEPTARLEFKLSYYRFTNRYRLTIGSLSKYYATLDEALSALGNIAGWAVLDVADWSEADARRAQGRVRLALDTGALPRPFQLGALGDRDWALSSPWTDVKVRS